MREEEEEEEEENEHVTVSSGQTPISNLPTFSHLLRRLSDTVSQLSHSHLQANQFQNV